MASLFTHAFIGAAIGRGASPIWRKDRRFWPADLRVSDYEGDRVVYVDKGKDKTAGTCLRRVMEVLRLR